VTRAGAIVCAALLWAGAAQADERSSALVEAFRAVCAAELPNFSRIEAKAMAANWPVNMDAGTPRQPDGPFNHIKSWMVALPSGSHELSAVEARGPAGEVSSCAITAADGLPEPVMQDLKQALGLGPPEREAIAPDGTRRSAWRVKLQGEGVILLMIDGTPKNTPGIYLNLTHRLVAGS